MTSDGDLMSSETGQDRAGHYQQQGWWPGERLEQRYKTHVLSRPDAVAVVDSTGRNLNHGTLWQRAEDLAGVLAEHGIRAGDVVLLFLPNRVEWQIALLAVLQLRAVPASIPTKTEPDTLAYAAGLVGSRLILTAESTSGDDLLKVASQAASEAPQKPGVLCVSADGGHRWVGASAIGKVAPEIVDGLDHIMFTSSTTGLPKAVMHTADTLAALNILFAERFALDSARPIFMGSPLGHSVGGIHGARLALHTGAALVLQEIWDPAAALQMIEQYQCDFTAAATPFLKDLLDHSQDEQQSEQQTGTLCLRTFLCGGAPVPPDLLEQAWQQFPNTFVTNLWGMTEGGLVTCVPESPKEKLIATAGIGLPGLELQVIGDDGQVLDSNQEGELVMRGPGVFLGYCGQDDLYQSLLTDNGFFHTGDLARIDEDNYVQITGRLKDLIIRGGVNISPLRAEDILASHPKLRSVAIVGFPDDRLGERICVVVEPAEEKPALEELISFASDRGLPKRQWPEVIRYIDAMPRTAAGKIRKPVLQTLIKRAGPEQVNLEMGDVNR